MNIEIDHRDSLVSINKWPSLMDVVYGTHYLPPTLIRYHASFESTLYLKPFSI